MDNVQKVIAELAQTNGCKFASVTYTAKDSGELARHSILLNVSTAKLYEKSLRILRAKLHYLKGLDLQAAQELIASLSESLQKGIGQNDNYTLKDVRKDIFKGVWVSSETGNLFLQGFSRGKVVLREGVYKSVNSKPLTIAKNKLRKCLPISRIRTFKLDSANLERVKVNGQTLEVS